MSRINCPLCGHSEAEVRTTKQKADAKRKMKPKAFLHCPDCGSLFSNKVNFSNRIQQLLATAQAKADLSDKQGEKKPDLSDNNQTPPQKSGFFNNWGTLL